MTIQLRVGDTFPTIELPNHNGKPESLRRFTRPGEIDERHRGRVRVSRAALHVRAAARPGNPRRLQRLVLRRARGIVRSFDLATGNGTIARDDDDEAVFFNFTAIPGAGYRTMRPGTRVAFEVVAGRGGPTARNVQRDSVADSET